MSNKFQQTVNLRKTMKQSQRSSSLKPNVSKNNSELGSQSGTEFFKKRRISRNERINDLYEDKNADKEEWQKIERPSAIKINDSLIKWIALLAVVLFVGLAIPKLFFYNQDKGADKISKELKWYAVKLVNEREFYGQIGDTAADPVKMSNVYYNYDQINDNDNTDSQTRNLRLVKRGKEAHGPSGVMELVRSQILYMEPLKEDSKVLKAILEYER